MSKDYTKISNLNTIYLEDSFLLNIDIGCDYVNILIEAVLTPEHALYGPPKKGQYYCFINGIIKFISVMNVNWIKKIMKPIYSADKDVCYGNIDFLYLEDGVYHIGGEWGELEIISDKEPEFIVGDNN